MMDHVISFAGGDSQRTHHPDPLQDCAPEGLKAGPDQTILNLPKIMGHDIQSSLLSMLATLKLLNRGYYGNMDEGVANQTKDLLSSATRLIGRMDACLGRASVVKEEVEIAAPKKAGIE